MAKQEKMARDAGLDPLRPSVFKTPREQRAAALKDMDQRLQQLDQKMAEGGCGQKDSGPKDGPGAFHPTAGRTVNQEICDRKCADSYSAYLAAKRSAEGIQNSADKAKQDADKANQNALDLDKKVQDAQTQRDAARAELHRPHPDTSNSDELARLNALANTDLTPLKAAAAKAHADAQLLAKRQMSLAESAQRARNDLNAASKAYEDCKKRCQDEADKASGKPAAKPKGPQNCASSPDFTGIINGVACQIGQ
jgi:hypothetical protein